MAEKKKKKLSELEKKKQKNRRLRPKAPPSHQETPAPRTVVNLSGVDLSPPKLSLLSKGLKFQKRLGAWGERFCPTLGGFLATLPPSTS